MTNYSVIPNIYTIYQGPSEDILTILESPSNLPISRNIEQFRDIIFAHIRNTLGSERAVYMPAFESNDFLWINTRPLSFDQDLKNKIIVLDFFTYCCVNCEHTLPLVKQVADMAKKYPALVVIGVHSPKFVNEKDTISIKHAVKRKGIKYPVLHDPSCYLWNILSVNCWPTVIIMSPSHQVLFTLTGEIQAQKMKFICEEVLEYFQTTGASLNKKILHFETFSEQDEDILLYPTGVTNVATSNGASLLISDTGHHRLLLVSNSGAVLDIIGDGNPGLRNGAYNKCRFNDPHGVAWWLQRFVFVADTSNNCIRMVDLEAKLVSTVFNGNEEKNEEENEEEIQSSSLLDEIDQYKCGDRFASPWDLCIGPLSNGVDGESLYIAVAGSHQIWELNLDEDLLLSGRYSDLYCLPYAGSGKEQVKNSTSSTEAAFAQPSGIACTLSIKHRGVLFIADSESSSIRSISLFTGEVKTVVGASRNHMELGAYGDVNGAGYDVKLQHPMGICAVEQNRLLFTDTYNHKIKIIDVQAQKCTVYAGTGKKGDSHNTNVFESSFNEPNGICLSSDGKFIFVIDTNNHAIKVIDHLKQLVKRMDLYLPKTSCIDGGYSISDDCEDGSSQKTIALKFGGTLECYFKLKPKEDEELNHQFPPFFTLVTKGYKEYTLEVHTDILTCVRPSLKFIFDESEEKMIHAHSKIKVKINYKVCKLKSKSCHPAQNEVCLDISLSHYGMNMKKLSFFF